MSSPVIVLGIDMETGLHFFRKMWSKIKYAIKLCSLFVQCIAIMYLFGVTGIYDMEALRKWIFMWIGKMSKKTQWKVKYLNCTMSLYSQERFLTNFMAGTAGVWPQRGPLFVTNCTSPSAFQSAVWCGRKPSFFFLIMCITFSCQQPSPMPDSLPSGFATYISRWDVCWLIYPQSFLMPSMIWIFFVCLFPWFITSKACFLSSIAVPCSLHRLPSHTAATLHLSSRGRWTPPCCWWKCEVKHNLHSVGSLMMSGLVFCVFSCISVSSRESYL